MKLPGSLFLVLVLVLVSTMAARAQAQTVTPAPAAARPNAPATATPHSPPPSDPTVTAEAGAAEAPSGDAQSDDAHADDERASADGTTGAQVPAPTAEAATGTAAMFGPPGDRGKAPSAVEDSPLASTAASAAATFDDPPNPSESPALPRNTIGGHLFLSARAGLAAPFGKIARNTPQTDYAQASWGFGADLGYGVARDVALGVYGDLLPLSDTDNCPACSPLSAGLGLFVRYHLVQGLNFDPWASYGIGVRTLSLQDGAAQGDYVGLEWLRVTFGGDFYPSRYVGFGPYLELGAGSFFAVPAQESAGGVHFRFQTGLRVAVDFMGR